MRDRGERAVSLFGESEVVGELVGPQLSIRRDG